VCEIGDGKHKKEDGQHADGDNQQQHFKIGVRDIQIHIRQNHEITKNDKREATDVHEIVK
jgi:hypothetical protein